MKRLLVFISLVVLTLLTFGIIERQAEGQRSVFGTGGKDELELAKTKSIEVLRSRDGRASFGNVDEFSVRSNEIDAQGYAHTRFQQRLGDVPVWEGEAIVHHRPDGELFTVTDSLKPLEPISTVPNLKPADAIRAAKKMYAGSRYLTEAPTADLWIYPANETNRLAYRVSMMRMDGSNETSMPVIFIDAQTGEKLFQYDNFQTGTGNSLYSGTVVVGTTRVGSTFYMENLTRSTVPARHGTFNYGNTTTTVSRVTDTDDI